MKISAPELTLRDNELVYSVQVEFSDTRKTLWYSVEKEYSALVSNRTDAALLGLLIPAMARGEDIHVEGKVSEKLYYNLSGRYQKILKAVIPSLHVIKIRSLNVQPETQAAQGVATGFSAGIDSFSVLADHLYSDVPSSYRITHLLFNNVGSHGSGIKGDEVFESRYKSLKVHADQLGLPFIKVNSNLNSFYQQRGIGFQQTHTPRNTSVALLLQRGIGKYLYASTFDYQNLFVGETYDMAYSDALTLPLMSTEVVEATSVGSEYTRVEKTLMVSNIEDSYNSLDVCVKPLTSTNRNCSTCWKCKRTLLTFEIGGVIERYSNVFNLAAYRQGKTRENFIAEVINSKDPLLKEIVVYAKQKSFKLPFYSYALAATGIPGLNKKVRKLSRGIKNYKLHKKKH